MTPYFTSKPASKSPVEIALAIVLQLAERVRLDAQVLARLQPLHALRACRPSTRADSW